MKTINDMREAHSVPSIYGDVMANRAATEYANYLLMNPEDPAKVEELCKANHVSGTVIPLMGFAILEEDEDHKGKLHDQLMDAHGLLLELEYELGVLADTKHTHIGIGFAFNKEQVKVVEFVTEKPVMVNQLNESEDGGIEARGVVLNKEIGIYAARVVAVGKMNKDVKAVGPADIQFDKGSGNFIVNIPGPLENLFFCQADPKLIQFYIRRKQIDKIEYGKDTGEKVNVAHLELSLTLPCEYVPDPRTVIEDAADIEREARDHELRKKKQEELEMIKQAEKVARLAEKEKQKEALMQQRGDDPSAGASGDESSANQSRKSKSRTQGDQSAQSKDQSNDMGDMSEEMGSNSEDEFEEDSEDSGEIAELPT